MFRTLLIALAAALVLACAGLAQASYASFTRPTDTISAAGDVSLGGQATYEAVVRLTQTAYTFGVSGTFEGMIWNSWERAAQDTRLSILNGGSLAGNSYPLNWPSPISAGDLQTNTWYDLAYVYDGSEERLYLDGNLIVWRPATGNISIGSSTVMAIGAIARDGGIVSSFQGDIQSLRISDSARYSGASYTPNLGDFTNDPATQLLYNFDQIPAGGASVMDLSGHGHTGTPGSGFSSATAPEFGVVPEPAASALLAVFVLAALIRRRNTCMDHNGPSVAR